MGDATYWNGRFEERENKILDPERTLVENMDYFKEGSALDIACGDGRNTLYLLEKGFKVTGIDFSTKALERLSRFVKDEGYEVETKQIDLSSPKALENIGVFHNVVVNHYRLNKENLDRIGNHLSENGILFISGHGYRNKGNERIREKDLIQPADFENLKDEFELIKYKEEEDARGFLVTYIFRKRYQYKI